VFRTVCVKFRDTKQLQTNNPTQGWCQGLWSGSRVLSSADLESKTTLESGLDSWGHPSSVSVVLTSLTVAPFMWSITCYCERVCLNWFCSCSAFLNLVILSALSQVWKNAFCGRHVCPFVCPYVTFYRELNGASHFHEILYIKSLQTAVKQPPIPWKSAQRQTYITLGIFQQWGWNQTLYFQTDAHNVRM
jgi:hypothetical protein